MTDEMKRVLSWRTNRYARANPAAFYRDGRPLPRDEVLPPHLRGESAEEFRARLGMEPMPK